MLAVSARKRVPTPMEPVGDQFGATHLRVVARLIPFIRDEVEHFLRWSVDEDLAFDADPVGSPSLDVTVEAPVSSCFHDRLVAKAVGGSHAYRAGGRTSFRGWQRTAALSTRRIRQRLEP